MSEHTEGPWLERLDEEGGAFVTGDGTVIANMVGPKEKRQANARLIAAAPDLLEALKVCAALIHLQNGNLHQDTNAILEMARLAVVKAEGPSPNTGYERE